MIVSREGYLAREQAAATDIRKRVVEKQNDLAKIRLQIGQLKRDEKAHVSVAPLQQRLSLILLQKDTQVHTGHAVPPQETPHARVDKVVCFSRHPLLSDTRHRRSLSQGHPVSVFQTCPSLGLLFLFPLRRFRASLLESGVGMTVVCKTIGSVAQTPDLTLC